MNIPDETLMAFADGELDDSASAAVEAAMREDPEVAQRVAEHRALRRRLEKAYAAELSEPIPGRLLRAANRTPGATSSTSFERSAQAARPAKSWWRPMGAIAASVIIGFGLGYGGWRQTSSPLTRNARGALVARGELAQALTQQLAAEQSPTAEVKIGLSFLAKSGDYCRTFSLAGAVSPSGLACHQGQEWRIQSLSQSGDTGSTAAYRTAGSGMPAEILKSVEEEISGEPLDPSAESAARSAGWKRAR